MQGAGCYALSGGGKAEDMKGDFLMQSRTRQLHEYGQSLWLDNIQRRELHDGTLERLIREDAVRGVTSNPTIFMNAVSRSSDYDRQISELCGQGLTPEAICQRITLDDIRAAAKLFLPVHEASGGEDGFVSIELNPLHAFDVDASTGEARRIVAELAMPNIMIKVPATPEGCVVVRQLVAEGMHVNVTLLFSPERYRQVACAYIEALEERRDRGLPLAGVHSVASFFISRIDTSVDRRLDRCAAENPAARELRGLAAVAVAKVTYAAFRELFWAERFEQLRRQGARVQRVLWASTGTKDPAYSDVKYVDSLIGPHTVNTLPPKTIDAFRDHGVVRRTVDEHIDAAPGVLRRIAQCGVDMDAVYAALQAEGVKAFEDSYLDLLRSIEAKGRALTAGT
jgi:transaldolase